jgi:hypothetical protein
MTAVTLGYRPFFEKQALALHRFWKIIGPGSAVLKSIH